MPRGQVAFDSHLVTCRWGTRRAHQRCTRATSVSGNPVVGIAASVSTALVELTADQPDWRPFVEPLQPAGGGDRRSGTNCRSLDEVSEFSLTLPEETGLRRTDQEFQKYR